MSKHTIKELDREIDSLRSQVWYLNDILINITDWLEDEASLTLNPGEISDSCSPENDPVVLGRVECSKSLLEQIEKWENEEQN